MKLPNVMVCTALATAALLSSQAHAEKRDLFCNGRELKPGTSRVQYDLAYHFTYETVIDSKLEAVEIVKTHHKWPHTKMDVHYNPGDFRPYLVSLTISADGTEHVRFDQDHITLDQIAPNSSQYRFSMDYNRTGISECTSKVAP